MYPEAESVFWSDMRTLRHFATIAQPVRPLTLLPRLLPH
jgi:hypothetical protein